MNGNIVGYGYVVFTARRSDIKENGGKTDNAADDDDKEECDQDSNHYSAITMMMMTLIWLSEQKQNSLLNAHTNTHTLTCMHTRIHSLTRSFRIHAWYPFLLFFPLFPPFIQSFPFFLRLSFHVFFQAIHIKLLGGGGWDVMCVCVCALHIHKENRDGERKISGIFC